MGREEKDASSVEGEEAGSRLFGADKLAGTLYPSVGTSFRELIKETAFKHILLLIFSSSGRISIKVVYKQESLLQ